MLLNYPLLWLIWSLLLFAALENGICAHSVRRREDTSPDHNVPALGYQRFYANDSYIGYPIPCTDDDKVCFEYNLILDTASDTCQAIEEGYYRGCHLKVNTTECLRSGRVVGACEKKQDPCPGYRMAYDNRCYTSEIVRNVICDCNSNPTRHIQGGWECRCEPGTPTNVEQPKEAGRCRIPDFRFPVDRSFFTRSNLTSKKFFNLSCGDAQSRCFSEGKVWVEQAKNCSTLLDRGPCAEDEVVVLTKDKWVSGPAVCQQFRGGCPPGRIRMSFDGNCHSEREMRISAPGRPRMNIIGEYDVMGYETVFKYIPERQANGTCGFAMSAVGGAPPLMGIEPTTCTGDICEVFDVPPNPE